MNNNKLKIFISGKITGDSNYVNKFNKAEEYLRDKGYTVINPTILPKDLNTGDCLKICFTMLGCADVVYMLQDWKESRGATMEHEFASYSMKQIIYE